MTSWMRDVAIAVAGLGLGGWAASLLPGAGSPPSSPASVASPAVAVDDDCIARIRTLREERDGLARQVATLSAQSGVIVTQTAQAVGAPVPWPDEVPEAEAPAGFARRLEATTASLGATVLALDCDEYPCTAVVRLPRPDAPDDDWAALVEALEDRGLEHVEAWRGVRGNHPVPWPDGPRYPVVGISFLPPGASPAHRNRVTHRGTTLLQSAREQARAGARP